MSIRWIVPEDIEKICKDTFQVVAKQNIQIPGGQFKTISTGIGFELANGMVIASANNSLNCFSHPTIILERGITENLEFKIHNITRNAITINEGDNICIIKYLN